MATATKSGSTEPANQQKGASVIPAGNHFSLTESNSSKIINHLQELLRSGPEGLPKINAFTMASAKMTGKILGAIAKKNLPAIEVSDLDTAIKVESEAIVEQSELCKKATAEVDAEIEKLLKKKDEISQPFSQKIVIHKAKIGEINTSKAERVQPLLEAIGKFREELIEMGKAEDVDEQTMMTLVSISQPSLDIPGLASTSASSTPRTGTGGRGGGVKVIIEKAGRTVECRSLNAARALVYTEVEGKEPTFGANASNCEAYLKSHGWTVKTV